MKKESGITLVSLVLTIVLILIVSGMMGYYTITSLDLKDVNNMYSDIDILQNEIDNYYIKNDSLPVLEGNVQFSISNKNINDEPTEYYVIDLSKLGPLKLNYGADFERIKNSLNISADASAYKDLYIINSVSQTIYYYKGISFEGKTYHYRPIEYMEVNTTTNNTVNNVVNNTI